MALMQSLSKHEDKPTRCPLPTSNASPTLQPDLMEA